MLPVCSVLTVIIYVIVNTNALIPSKTVEKLVYKWAPLVFLAPGEKFFPSSVPEFLEHVLPIPLGDQHNLYDYDHDIEGGHSLLPVGNASEQWSLVTRESVDLILQNKSSFIFGKNPSKHPVPVYTVIVQCNNNKSENVISSRGWPSFHVTYWMFYPFNQGKAMCTVDMGRFGAWPIPKVNNLCLGNVKEFGNHVGDWEHVTLLFQGSPYPKKMYISSHDVGAIYKFEKGQFVFDKWEIRKGILQRPTFPPKIMLSTPGHRPVLFAAKGSHGLWAAPGKHRFVRIPRLHDISGFGAAWQTWRHLVTVRDDSVPPSGWIRYRGRWGNPKSQCHPVSSLGIHICELSDGPKGIPTKKRHFKCNA